MKLQKNWLFNAILILGIGIVGAKRLQSIAKPTNNQNSILSEQISGSECQNKCNTIQSCVTIKDDQTKKYSDKLVEACLVLCGKGKDQFSSCKFDSACSDLFACLTKK
jgi:hypothetical protein